MTLKSNHVNYNSCKIVWSNGWVYFGRFMVENTSVVWADKLRFKLGSVSGVRTAQIRVVTNPVTEF